MWAAYGTVTLYRVLVSCWYAVHALAYFFKINFNIIHPPKCSLSFTSCMNLSSPPYMPHALPISFSLIWLPKWSSLLCSFLQSPVTSSLPSAPYSNSQTPSACSSFEVRQQFPHLYKTTDRIIVLCILIFMCLGRKQQDRRFWTEW